MDYGKAMGTVEQWDLYDENRRPIGRTMARGELMRPGEYHIQVSIWTVNSDKELLVTRRDPRKGVYAGKWENTGGGVLAGETSPQGAVRELREETGIAAAEEELILLGTDRTESAFVDVYLLKRDVPIGSIVLQEGETVDAKWVTLETLDGMVRDFTLALPIGIRLQHVREAFEAHIG